MIYQKTPAGLAEISAAQKTLNFRHRQVLIMVDGKRDVDSLIQLLRQPALEQTLDELQHLGYIADIAMPSGISARFPLAAIELTSQPKQDKLSDIQISEIRAILIASTEQYLGIMGRGLKVKIDAAADDSQITTCASEWHMAMRES
ncbi:MAG: hypothetical protein V4588_00030, partial [Pseudomonadota bacterium]